MGLDHGLCQQLHLEKGSSGKSCLRKVAGFVLFPKLLSFLLTIIIMIIIIIIYLTAVVVLREFVVILRGVSFLVAKRQGGFPASRRKPGIPFNSFLLSLLSDNNWKPGCRLCVSPSVRVHTNSILCFFFFFCRGRSFQPSVLVPILQHILELLHSSLTLTPDWACNFSNVLWDLKRSWNHFIVIFTRR